MNKLRSEDILGKKLDYCFADSLLKTICGAAIGTITSIALFKARRTWPIFLGTGIGIGMGWSNCKHELNEPYVLRGKKILASEDSKKPAYQIVLQP